jgi:hypothetical protein
MPKGKTPGRRPAPRLTRPRTPNPVHLAEIYDDLLKRPNVLGCFIGRKRREGRATSRLSVICCVREKVALRNLAPEELLPLEVTWPRGVTRPGRLAIDVRVLSRPFRPAAVPATSPVAGPGDGLTSGASQATVGIALRHPTFGDVVTTAGHLVLDSLGAVTYPAGQLPQVELASAGSGGALFPGSAVRAVRSATADYALVQPAGLTCENLFANQTPVGLPYTPSDQEIGAPLFVLSARGTLAAIFLGVYGSLPVGDNGLMQNLLLTDFATDAGDSGSCLVDAQSRAWGLLVGFSELDGNLCSVFISAALPLALEGAVFL